MKEGGERCFKCYALRLEETARMAKEAEFDYFTTTLTISPMKNAEKLNTIGAKIGEKYGVKYLQSDFKKKNGYKRSIELSNEFGLYRQDYCGCEFSVRDRKQESAKSRKNKRKKGTIWHSYGADVLRKRRISWFTISMHRFRLIRNSMHRI